MSIDFNAVCDHCKIKCHFGQMSGSGSSLAYGGANWPEDSTPIRLFIFKHAYCDLKTGVRIVVSDTREDRACDDYRDWEWDEGDPFPEPVDDGSLTASEKSNA